MQIVPELNLLLNSQVQKEGTEDKMVNQPAPVYRKDYKPTPFLIDTVNLSFNLNDDVTRVSTKLHMVPNYDGDDVPEIVLNGRSDVTLVSLKVGGQEWPQDKYEVTSKFLTIKGLPSGDFDLETEVDIKPQENTILEGLYKSGGNYCSQVREIIVYCLSQAK